MKILFIYTGFPGIYPYIESWIINAFKKLGHVVIIGDLSVDPLRYKEIIFNQKIEIIITLVGTQINSSVLDYFDGLDIPFCLWLSEDPYYLDSSLKIIRRNTFVFTIDLAAYHFYKENGFPKIFHLPLGTCPEVFKSLERYPDNQKSQLLMLGYPYPTRIKLAQYIMDHSDFHLTLVGKGWFNLLSKIYRKKDQLNLVDQWVSPHVAFDYYSGAEIILNQHRDDYLSFTHNSNKVLSKSLNNRTYDICATGAFQLVDFREDIGSQFNTDELIFYLNYNDCLDKINFYLANSKEREKIGLKSRERTLLNHTFEHRCETMIESIQLTI